MGVNPRSAKSTQGSLRRRNTTYNGNLSNVAIAIQGQRIDNDDGKSCEVVLREPLITWDGEFLGDAVLQSMLTQHANCYFLHQSVLL